MFEPGKSGNPGGRPKGSKNKRNEEVREMIRAFVLENWTELKDSFSEMEAKDKGKLINAFIRHFLPPPVNPERLSLEQLEQIAEHLRSQKDEK